MMANFSPELKQKVALLKAKQRQIEKRYLWRSIVVSLVAGGILATAFSLPWQIQQPAQIVLNGNRYIPPSVIHNAIDLDYPQSAIVIPLQKLQQRLESMPILESVEVTKTIFPPLVKIYLQERIPVATTVSEGKIGFLDSQGVWLEPQFYRYEKGSLPLTKIEVVNFQSQYSSTWKKIYSLIKAYPALEIREVNWDDMGNLLLITSNYQVFLGTNSSLLPQQFATLASFPDLTNHQKLQNIARIDLTNPDVPLIDRQDI